MYLRESPESVYSSCICIPFQATVPAHPPHISRKYAGNYQLSYTVHSYTHAMYIHCIVCVHDCVVCHASLQSTYRLPEAPPPGHVLQAPPPHLSSVARCVLAQPICASAPQNAIGQYTVPSRRLRAVVLATPLRTSSFTAMRPYSCMAIGLRGKLQSASYVQEAAKWDSDPDSDESDEEDLKI